MTRVIGLIGLPPRGPGGHRRPRFPAVLAVPRRRHRRQRDAAVADRRLPLGAARRHRRHRCRSTGAAYKPERLERRPVPAGDVRQQQGDAPRRRLPAVLALRRPAVVDDRAGAPLLLASRPRRLRARNAALFMGNDRGERYEIQFPLVWHFASERRGTSTTVTPLGYYHTRPRRLEPGRRADGAAAVRAVGEDSARTSRWSRCSGTSPIAPPTSTTTVVALYWHRRWGGETTDALFPLLYYRRGARPGGSDETSFTFFPLVHYRRDAQHARAGDAALRVGARARSAAAASLGPYFWYDDKELSLPLHPVPAHRRDRTRDTGERTRQFGPLVPGRRARAHARACCSRCSARYTDEQETDTWVVPDLLPHAPQQRRSRRRAAAALLAVGVRRSRTTP